MTICTCEFCKKQNKALPVANGGVFSVIRNPSNLKGADNVWGIAGPHRHCPHCCATWICKSEQEAIEMAAKMNAGHYPPEDDL